MKIKNTLNIFAGLSFFALAPLMRAQCPQSCDGANVALGEFTLENNTGNQNTAVGYHAGVFITTGSNDTAVGFEASGSAGGTGSFNTALGSGALNTSGDNNTGVGYFALYSGNSGTKNTALGANAMVGDFNSNTTGSNNTAIGFSALALYTTATNNTAIGYQALYTNKTGSNNVATGRGALYKNTASDNTATGYQAMNKNTSGPGNTANGYQALYSNITGFNNTATGFQSLYNTTGWSNTANGQATLYSNTSGTFNTALGSGALYGNSTGSNNIAVGASAGTNLTTGSNNIDLGGFGVGGESNTIRVGNVGVQTNTYVAGISGVTVAGGIGVIVDSNGHLGTTTSSARYKDNIQPMEKASEAILSLQPVTFHYKKELDPKGIPQFGLLAEQVAKVNPDLVARDDQGKPYSVRYEAVNTMLLNEFLKEHSKATEQSNINRQQEATITELKAMLAEQQKEIETLKAGLERVSDRLDATKPVGRLATNNE